jgi:hypothetical protein
VIRTLEDISQSIILVDKERIKYCNIDAGREVHNKFIKSIIAHALCGAVQETILQYKVLMREEEDCSEDLQDDANYHESWKLIQRPYGHLCWQNATSFYFELKPFHMRVLYSQDY